MYLDDTEFHRVRWHSRRGMLELDLVLGPFVEKHLRDLDEENQRRYVYLLTSEDQDLFRWFLSAEKPEDEEKAKIVAVILKLHHERG